jgi:hypothetical protein
MVLIGLIIITAVFTAITVPRIRRKLPVHAVSRTARSGATAERKR